MNKLIGNTILAAEVFGEKTLIGTVLTLALFLSLAICAQAQFSVLYNFGSEGGDPVRGTNPGFIAQGHDGNLYTTTVDGGSDGPGTVFKITPAGTLTVLYSFDGIDLGSPYSGLTLGTDGNYYGAAIEGGPNSYGAVFKITPQRVLTILHGFGDSDGSEPFGAPIEGPDGSFYGTTTGGGSNGYGAVFKVTSVGQFTLLHSFGYSDGVGPFAPLLQASDGKLYGTTYDGGPYVAGTIYEITRTGTFSVIHAFYPHILDGATPLSGLVQASDGNLYGTTSEGGTGNAGTIYVIGLGGVNYSVLYNLDGITASQPEAELSQDTNGILYGDTYAGGTTGYGVFFSFENALLPFIIPVPYFGAVGRTIGVLGQGFTGTMGVSFNGTSALFHVTSNNYLTATIPSGARTGVVTVTTPNGELKSNGVFYVIP
jgi:uncharacterized repeat protein (TIGR03803 family)